MDLEWGIHPSSGIKPGTAPPGLPVSSLPPRKTMLPTILTTFQRMNSELAHNLNADGLNLLHSTHTSSQDAREEVTCNKHGISKNKEDRMNNIRATSS
jgi:hypothetical protein